MIERILIAVFTSIASRVLALVLDRVHTKQIQAGDEKDIDARLAKFKAAYTEAFDGQPLTHEQKAKLRAAAADFIRGGTSNGGV